MGADISCSDKLNWKGRLLAQGHTGGRERRARRLGMTTRDARRVGITTRGHDRSCGGLGPDQQYLGERQGLAVRDREQSTGRAQGFEVPRSTAVKP